MCNSPSDQNTVSNQTPSWWKGSGWYAIRLTGDEEAVWVDSYESRWDYDDTAEDNWHAFLGDETLPSPLCRIADESMDMLDAQAIYDYRLDMGY